jgi:imidazolonepropionase-like amidohydrolase
MQLLLGSIMLLGFCLAPQAAAEVMVFRHATIHTVSDGMIPDGVLVVADGKIEAVAASDELMTPVDAVEVDLTGRIMIPGMVDSHSHLGGPSGGDSSDPLNPAARSLDSIDVMSPAFWRARSGGITTINVMPGSGHLMSGQTTYLKIRKDPQRIEDWLFCEDAINGICGSMKMANGTNSIREKPFPGTRSRSTALQRNLFVEAQNYQAELDRGSDKDGPVARDLRMEAVLEVLSGARRIQFHTHRHNDIMTVLRLADEFDLDPVIQHGSDAWKVAPQLAEAGAPVSLTFIDSPGGKEEALGWNMEAATILDAAGVDVSFNTDDYILDSRLFLRYAAIAVRNGLSEDKALEALTLAGARALRLEDRVGSLEAGKDADFVVLSGAPFSTYTQIEETWVEGQRVFNRADPEHRKYATGGVDTYDAIYHSHEGTNLGAAN